MKKGLIEVALISFLFIFLSSGILASPPADAPAYGNCTITPVADCSQADGNYIVMGLSALTNAHGEFPYSSYPYVLCCGGGTGNTVCTAGGTNKIIGLSSSTNAHGESPEQSNYLTNVCYEDLQCIATTVSCPADHKTQLLSLTGTTNAHIGGFNDYPTKICCKSSVLTFCKITSAKWNAAKVIDGQRVYLQLTGTGECSGASVAFKISRSDGDSSSIKNQPTSVTFSGTSPAATGLWISQWQSGGLLGLGDATYYFNASISKNPKMSIISSTPQLDVTKQSLTFCSNVNLCSDYSNQLDCQSDSCNVGIDSGTGIVDCKNASNICGCAWDTGSGTCKFGWNTISDCGTPATGCNYGCTLCTNQTTKTNYCSVGSICSSPDTAATNNNGTCDAGIDGCASSDCKDGDQDSCTNGTYCLSQRCFNIVSPPTDLGSCKITQSIDKTCDEEPAGYKIISWTGTWTGSQTSGEAYQNCITGGKSTVPCPAQVQLPFFDYIEMIASITVIALIYISLISRKKFKKKK